MCRRLEVRNRAPRPGPAGPSFVFRALIGVLVAACSDTTAQGGEQSGAQGVADGPRMPAEVVESDPLLRRSALRECSAADQIPNDTLRVATWNMKAARMASLQDIIAFIEQSRADVIALQEVDVNVRRTGEVDQPAVMAEALGFDSAFAVTVPYDGGLYGIAMLSRHGFTSVDRWELPSVEVPEPAINAVACVRGRSVRVVNVHADTDTARGTENLVQVVERVRPDIGAGLVVVGDFNQRPEEPGPQALFRAGFSDLFAEVAAPTFASERLDYVTADAPLAARAGTLVQQATPLSDHQLLAVDLLGFP
jgi:endonuclease/exonuclease/phosphatase family metal-dependent hydrolase